MRRIFELAGQITVNGLEALKKNLTGLEADLQKADKAIGKFGRQAEKIGTNLTKYVTAPIVGLAGGFAFLAGKTGQYADHLLDLQQITGLNTDKLQEFEHVARIAGVNFDGLVNTIGKLTNSIPEIAKGTGPAAEAIRKLGVNLYDSSGQVRDMNSLFPEMVKRLQNIKNPTERNAIAMDIFGRSMNDLAPVLGMTGEQLDRATREAHELGLVMGKDALEAADNYRMEIEKLKAQFTALWRNLVVDLLPTFKGVMLPLIQNQIMPAIKGLAERIKSATTWFTNLDDSTKKNILKFVALAAAIGPVIFGIGKTIAISKSLIATIALMKTAITGLTIAMMTNPFVAVIAGSAVLVAALIGLKKTYDDINESHKKFTAQTVEAAAREQLAKSVDVLEVKIRALVSTGKKEAEIYDEIEGETSDLVAQARELGYVITGNTKKRVESLDTIRSEIRGVMDASGALIKYKQAKEEAGAAGGIGLSAEEIAKADESLKKYQDALAAVTENRIENIERERVANVTAVSSIVATAEQKAAMIKAIDDKAALEREQVIYDEKKKREDAAKDALKARSDLEWDWSKKFAEQAGDRGVVLEMERQEAIKAAEQKGMDIAGINAYYDKEIEKADAATAEKTKKTWIEKTGEIVSQIGNYASQIVGMFTMATQNKIASNDNWYEKEKEAIEKSGVSNKIKEKRMEELDEKYNKKRKALQREAAVREKAGAIFGAIVGTAQAVVSALSTKPFIPLGLIAAGIAGVLGGIQTALIASQPIPFAKGAFVKGKRGGIVGEIAEGQEDEIVFPLKTGIKELAAGIVNTIRQFELPTMAPSFAMAGGGRSVEYHMHVGTLIADERGLKELERRQSQFRIAEAQRIGTSG